MATAKDILARIKDEEIEYKLVTSEESDVTKGLISTTSPIGRSLMGKKVGDEVTVEEELRRTEITQPAVLTVDIALTKLLELRAEEPDADQLGLPASIATEDDRLLGAVYRNGCDAAFPLSDHADFPDLLVGLGGGSSDAAGALVSEFTSQCWASTMPSGFAYSSARRISCASCTPLPSSVNRWRRRSPNCSWCWYVWTPRRDCVV